MILQKSGALSRSSHGLSARRLFPPSRAISPSLSHTWWTIRTENTKVSAHALALNLMVPMQVDRPHDCFARHRRTDQGSGARQEANRLRGGRSGCPAAGNVITLDRRAQCVFVGRLKQLTAPNQRTLLGCRDDYPPAIVLGRPQTGARVLSSPLPPSPINSRTLLRRWLGR